MPFVVSEKNMHGLLKIVGTLFRQGVLDQIFHTPADLSIDRLLGQRFKVEPGAGEIDGAGEIVTRVSERAVEVEHDEINRFLHSIRFKLKKFMKSTRIKLPLLFAARLIYLGLVEFSRVHGGNGVKQK